MNQERSEVLQYIKATNKKLARVTPKPPQRAFQMLKQLLASRSSKASILNSSRNTHSQPTSGTLPTWVPQQKSKIALQTNSRRNSTIQTHPTSSSSLLPNCDNHPNQATTPWNSSRRANPSLTCSLKPDNICDEARPLT